MLDFQNTTLPDVVLLCPRRFADRRGFFGETWNKSRLADAGIDVDFVQDNHSISAQVGTVRGLHFQAPPHAQDKLVRCGRGALFDVAVDLRRGSPTYGHWVGAELSFENANQLFIPKGFAHGFMTLQPDTEIIYKCGDYYVPASEGAVRWDSCKIDWPDVAAPPVLSDKDRGAPPFSAFVSPFIFSEPACVLT